MANTKPTGKHIELVAGADINLSTSEFKSDLNEIVKKINNDPPRIKISIDKTSIQDIKSQLEAGLKDIKIGSGGNGNGGGGKPSKGDPLKNNRLSKQYYGVLKSYGSKELWTGSSATRRMNTEYKLDENGNKTDEYLSMAYTEYDRALKAFEKERRSLAEKINGSLGANGLFIDASGATVQLEKYETEIKKLTLAYQNLRSAKKAAENETANVRVDENEALAIEKIKSRVNKYYNDYGDNLTPNLRERLKNLQKGLSLYGSKDENGNPVDGAFTGTSKEATKELMEIEAAARSLNKETDSAYKKLKNLFSSEFKHAAIGVIINGLRKVLQDVIQTVIELDDAVVNLQIATGYSREQTKALLSDYSSLAKEIGATTAEVANAADAWLRQGYSAEQSAMLVKNSMMLAKLGQIDSAEATTALTSAMKGYNLSAEDTEKIVDKLVAVDMIAATSAGDLAVAMAETNTSARIAGVSMDTLVGYIATVAEVTQDGAESVGTFFKTLFARMGNIKAGNLVDPETAEDLSDVESSLRGVGIELRDENGEFRNFAEVLDEVHSKWDKYGTVQQHAIAVAFSGTRQQEKFLTLMEHYGEAMEYASTAAGSAGTAIQKYNAAYMNSVTAAKAQMTASFEQFSQYVLNSDFLRDFYKLIADIVGELPSVIDSLGGLKNIVTLIVNLIASAQWVKFGNFFKQFTKDANPDTMGLIAFAFSKMRKGIEDLGNTSVIAAIKTKGLSTTLEAMAAKLSAIEKLSVILTIISVAMSLISFASTAFKSGSEETEETLDSLLNTASQTQQELDSVSSELEEKRDRLEEIQQQIKDINLGRVEISSDEDLANLIAESEELEEQIELLEQRERMLNGQNRAAQLNALYGLNAPQETTKNPFKLIRAAFDPEYFEELADEQASIEQKYKDVLAEYAELKYKIETQPEDVLLYDAEERLLELEAEINQMYAQFGAAGDYALYQQARLQFAFLDEAEIYDIFRSEVEKALGQDYTYEEFWDAYEQGEKARKTKDIDDPYYRLAALMGALADTLGVSSSRDIYNETAYGIIIDEVQEAVDVWSETRNHEPFSGDPRTFGDNDPSGSELAKAKDPYYVPEAYKEHNSKIDDLIERGVLAAMLKHSNQEYNSYAKDLLDDRFFKYGNIFEKPEIIEEMAYYGVSEELMQKTLAGLTEDEKYALLATDNFTEALAELCLEAEEADKELHSLSGAIKNLGKQQDALTKLGNIGEKVANGEDLGFSDISELSEELSNLKIPNAQELINKLISSSGKDRMSVLGEITEAIIDQTMASWDLSEASAEELDMYEDLMVAQLKEAGVSNAELVVARKMEIQRIKNAKAAEIEADASWSDIWALAEEETASEYTRIALAQLALEKSLLNKEEIDSSEDVQQLLNIANAAGVSAESLRRLNTAKKIYEHVETHPELDAYSREYMLNYADGLISGPIEYDLITEEDIEYDITDTGDPELDAWNKLVSKKKHLLETDQITQEEYYTWLASAYKDNISNTEEHADEIQQIEEELYNWEKERVRNSIDTEKAYLDNQLAQGLISEKHYNKQLKALYEDGYEDLKRSIEEKGLYGVDTKERLEAETEFINDVKDAHNAAYDAEKSDLEHRLAMNLITEEMYLMELQALYLEYYMGKKWYAEEAKEIEEELYEEQTKIIDKWANATADAVKSISKAAEDAVSSITTLIESSIDTHDENFNLDKSLLDHALAMNYISEEEYYKSLEELYKKYFEDKYVYMEQYWENQEAIYQHEQEALEESASAVEDIHARVVDLIKSELEDAIDAIEKTKDAYLDLIEIRRKALNEQKEEEDYQKDREEQLSNISELQRQLNALSRDTSVEGMRMYQEIAEELKEAQDALAEFDRDYAYDQMNEQLDNEADILEKNTEQETKALEELLDDNKYLVEEAWKRMDGLSLELFNQLEDYTKKHSTSIKDEITDVWDTATNAVKNYADAYQAYIGINKQIGVPGMTDGEFGQFGEYIDKKQFFNWGEIAAELAANMLEIGTSLLGDFAGILDSIFDNPATKLLNIGAGALSSIAGSGAGILTSVVGLLGGLAGGSDYVSKTGFYLTDELGEELKLVKNPTGANYTFLTRGSKVFTNDAVQRLMKIINNPDLLLSGNIPDIKISGIDGSSAVSRGITNQNVVIENTFEIKSSKPEDVAAEIKKLMPEIAGYTIGNLINGSGSVGVRRKAQQLR